MLGRLHWRFQLAIRALANSAAKETSNIRRSGWLGRCTVPVLSAGYLYYLPRQVSLATETKTAFKQVDNSPQNDYDGKIKKTFWQRFWRALIHIIRFFHLLIIFSPPILLFPLAFFKSTEDYWRDLFVKAVERAGVVFIKAFQYLSHRRDIIGP